jgi:Na+(H+)/acetate symporter ActP
MVDLYLQWKPAASERHRIIGSRIMTVLWALVLFVLAWISRGGGHVVEVGLSIASVAYGALLGVFLAGTLSKTATEPGAIVGMIGGFAINLFLWKQTGPILFTLGGHQLVLPKIAWTWFVLIGSIFTFALAWVASRLLPQKKTQPSH